MGTASEVNEGWWASRRGLRWSLAFVFVVALGLVPGVLQLYRVCQDELAAVGGEAVVEVCRGPALGDLGVVAGVVLFLILIAPDLSEFGVPGLLTVKRRVERQEQRQRELENELRNILIRQVRQANSEAQSVQIAIREFEQAAAEGRDFNMVASIAGVPRRISESLVIELKNWLESCGDQVSIVRTTMLRVSGNEEVTIQDLEHAAAAASGLKEALVERSSKVAPD